MECCWLVVPHKLPKVDRDKVKHLWTKTSSSNWLRDVNRATVTALCGLLVKQTPDSDGRGDTLFIVGKSHKNSVSCPTCLLMSKVPAIEETLD